MSYSILMLDLNREVSTGTSGAGEDSLARGSLGPFTGNVGAQLCVLCVANYAMDFTGYHYTG